MPISYKVEVESSGHHFTVEQGESVLDAALRQGVTLPYGCRGGTCGSCKGKIIEGNVDYGDYSPLALSDVERTSGMVLFCQAKPRSDLKVSVREIRRSGELAVKMLPARVARMERLAHDVMALYLVLPKNQRLQFLAGQYVQVVMRDGRRRSFSLANPPHDDEFLQLHVRRVPGGVFSEHVFSDMKEKAILRIEGPLGDFYLREESDRPVILLAGGTGFAPVKGIVEHALAEGVTRPLHLYWGVRAARDLYMDALARGWAATEPNFTYVPVLSQPAADDGWQGRTGHVHRAVGEDIPDLSGFEVYASGPPAMIEAARDDFVARGLDPARFYFDAFEYARD